MEVSFDRIFLSETGARYIDLSVTKKVRRVRLDEAFGWQGTATISLDQAPNGL
jgi:hypothetical protein